MKIALLAAGLGSRLGPLTEALPKALIEVAGDPLLFYALRFAGRLSPAEVVVVGGFGFPLVAAAIEARRGRDPDLAALPLRLVENPAFRDGNLVSLTTARPHLDDDFLIMNVDHIFHPSIAHAAAPAPDEVTAFIDTDRALGDDDMKVERRADGTVAKIAKTLTTYDAGYVGMTRVPRTALGRYWREVDAALAEEGRAIHVERILARLATGAAAPRCRDISGHGWLEVDTPSERSHAEDVLRTASWRP